ncbi:MAG: hypothetical protein CME80_17780 [Halomonas sp.]|nr:AAA family ATPase [Halomonas sp.]MBF59543.1 hypothetical protein [Halomonas sp.]
MKKDELGKSVSRGGPLVTSDNQQMVVTSPDASSVELKKTKPAKALYNSKSRRRGPFAEHSAATRVLLDQTDAFKGIGPARARKLIAVFGDFLHEAIINDDPRLRDILTKPVSDNLVRVYPDYASEAELAKWLDNLGSHPKLAKRIVSFWGKRGAEALQENPYLLLPWAGWSQAEELGRAVGVASDDQRRLVAGVEAVIADRRDDGHTWTKEAEIIRCAIRKLRLDPKTAAKLSEALKEAEAQSVTVSFDNGVQGLGAALMERQLAEFCCTPTEAKDLFSHALTQEDIACVIVDEEAKMNLALDSGQRAAAALPLQHRVSAIAGYAGSGKTTVLRATFSLLEAAGMTPHPIALAGRAVRRVERTTGVPARTIASVLRAPIVHGAGGLPNRRFSSRDVIVIDEASMVDLPQLWSLIRKIPNARMLLVGDPAQLPPIGPGRPFQDLLSLLPSVKLEKVHRQAAASGLPDAAAIIRSGQLPDLPEYQGPKPGLSFVPCDAATTAHAALNIARSMAPKTAVGDLQVLAARKSKVGGVHAINDAFSTFRGYDREHFPGNHMIRAGDPIMFIENDWLRGLVNGATGHYLGGLEVEIDNVRHTLDAPGDAKRIEPAYALTIHKSQGSQWRRVILALHPSKILDRSAIYTAITRAEEQVVIVGSQNALQAAVNGPNAADRRETGLAYHMQNVRLNS